MQQSSKAFKYCKYCKMSDHFIDLCPEILCKKCNERGHPHWKCIKQRNIGHAFDDLNSNKNVSNNRFNRTKGFHIEVIDEDNDAEEDKPTVKKNHSQNLFDALDDDSDDTDESEESFDSEEDVNPLFDSNSIFHFLQYKDSDWSEL